MPDLEHYREQTRLGVEKLITKLRIFPSLHRKFGKITIEKRNISDFVADIKAYTVALNNDSYKKTEKYLFQRGIYEDDQSTFRSFLFDQGDTDERKEYKGVFSKDPIVRLHLIVFNPEYGNYS